jgi:integrase
VLAKYVASPEFKGLRDQATELIRCAHLFEHLGFVPVASLTLSVLDEYRTKRAAEYGNRKVRGGRVPTSPSTRNREVDRLSRALTWAAERNLIATNPIAVHPDEEEPPARQTHVTSDEVDALRAGAMELAKPLETRLALRAMISTTFDGLLRRGEVCRLRWPMLDFKSGCILLPQSETKAHRDTVRIAPLSDRAIDDVRAMPRDVESPIVFLTSRRGPWHPRTFLRYVQDVARAVGVKGAPGERFVVHDLRAGGATEQLEAGTPERVVMDMAGWTTRDMIDRYFRRRGAASVASARARVLAARRRG